MSRMFKPLAALCLVFGAAAVSAPVAFAAAPANDNYATPMVIAAGQTYSEVTVQATTSALESSLNPYVSQCGGSVNQGVWLSYTPTKQQYVVASVNGSSYAANVAWVIGTPPTVSIGACGTNAPVALQAGQNYRFLVYGTQVSPAGIAKFTLGVVPAPPTLTTTVSSVKLQPNGTVKVSGTYRCSTTGILGVNSFTIDVGVLAAVAGAAPTVPLPAANCNNTVKSYAINVASADGPFTIGLAEEIVAVHACNVQGGFCGQDNRTSVVPIT